MGRVRDLLEQPPVSVRSQRGRRRVPLVLALSSCAALVCGCAAAGERENREALAKAGQTLADLPQASEDDPLGEDWGDEAAAANFDGTPQAYVDYALEHHHGLRASWERWRAATHRIARERRLPMPTITYGLFIRQVETRVGPQRHKLGVRQRFPWPGQLTAGADAAAAQARAMQREFEAKALEVRARVLWAYWQLWLVRKTREVEREQLELYEGIAGVARGQLTVGNTTLADVQQIDLTRARLADQIDGLGERERQAEANLIATVAAPPRTEAPTLPAGPELAVPRDEEAKLRAALVDHPLLDRWQVRAEAADLRVKEARNARAPGFALGVDWIEVGPARAAGVPDSGKDAVMVSVGIEVPLWQGNYAEDQKAAEADAAAARAEWAAARDRAAAELDVSVAQIRDTARRAELYSHTLIPQAEGALESTLGGYATGKGDLAAILIAERQLLELRLGLLEVESKHAVAWAELERVVGRVVERVSAHVEGEDAGPDEGPEPKREAGEEEQP